MGPEELQQAAQTSHGYPFLFKKINIKSLEVSGFLHFPISSHGDSLLQEAWPVYSMSNVPSSQTICGWRADKVHFVSCYLLLTTNKPGLPG